MTIVDGASVLVVVGGKVVVVGGMPASTATVRLVGVSLSTVRR